MSVQMERKGDVAVLTMADEARRNALSIPLVEAMLGAIEDSRRDGARALVITSSGSVFCAGADLSAMNKETRGNVAMAQRSPIDLFEALSKEPRPVLAAVNGGAFGGGFELTLCCDAIVASHNAFFVFPELAHGVYASTGVSRLPAHIGVQKTRELVLTRRRLGAAEALQLGLVSTVVANTAVVATAVAAAQEIVSGGAPSVIAASKADLERCIGTDWAWVRASRSRYNPEEREEGSAAFVEKRPANYDRFWKQR